MEEPRRSHEALGQTFGPGTWSRPRLQAYPWRPEPPTIFTNPLHPASVLWHKGSSDKVTPVLVVCEVSSFRGFPTTFLLNSGVRNFIPTGYSILSDPGSPEVVRLVTTGIRGSVCRHERWDSNGTEVTVSYGPARDGECARERDSDVDSDILNLPKTNIDQVRKNWVSDPIRCPHVLGNFHVLKVNVEEGPYLKYKRSLGTSRDVGRLFTSQGRWGSQRWRKLFRRF